MTTSGAKRRGTERRVNKGACSQPLVDALYSEYAARMRPLRLEEITALAEPEGPAASRTALAASLYQAEPYDDERKT